jgi:hypothetical protein
MFVAICSPLTAGDSSDVLAAPAINPKLPPSSPLPVAEIERRLPPGLTLDQMFPEGSVPIKIWVAATDVTVKSEGASTGFGQRLRVATSSE